MLSANWIELPYETAEAKAEADKMNAEIAGTGFRTARMAYDWAFRQYDDLHVNILKNNPGAKPALEVKTPLKSGDLVRIFKTVSDGDVYWEGTVDYDYEKYHHGYQKEMSPGKWVTMFHEGLPAKLEQDGKTYFGALDAFAETGTEGEIWSMHEYGKTGYAGLSV